MVGNQCEIRRFGKLTTGSFAVPGGTEGDFRNSKREILGE